MPEMKPITIWAPDGSTILGEFVLWDESSENLGAVRLELSFNERRIVADSDVGYFDALCKIRTVIEPEGYRLCCFGASKGVYPSGMSRSMGTGDKAYRLEMGKPALAKDLVSIFDTDVSVVPVGSEEQRVFFNMWVESLR
jgi:hypothetical protein